MEHPTAVPKTIYLDENDFNVKPNLNIEDTGKLTLNFRVVGVSINDDENNSEERTSYTLEYSVDDVNVESVSLQEATRRAGNSKDIYVKTQSNPSPG